MTDKLLVTPADAAKALAISPRKLWELTNRRLVPHVRIGRILRYDVADLRTWLAEIKTPAASG